MSPCEQRYPSDTSDDQWALIEPLPPQANTGGRLEKHPARAMVDAVLYHGRSKIDLGEAGRCDDLDFDGVVIFGVSRR